MHLVDSERCRAFLLQAIEGSRNQNHFVAHREREDQREAEEATLGSAVESSGRDWRNEALSEINRNLHVTCEREASIEGC